MNKRLAALILVASIVVMAAGYVINIFNGNPEALITNGVFDAREIQIGDTILNMKVTQAEVPDNREGNDYPAVVMFSGKATVTGSYYHHKEDPFLDHEISFTVDEDSAQNLPRLKHDERSLWFCLTNHDEAEMEFGPPGSEGKAKIIIDDYTIRYEPTETWNTARLVKVIEKIGTIVQQRVAEPIVLGVEPQDGAVDVSRNSRIGIRFDRPMNYGSVAQHLIIVPAVAGPWHEDGGLIYIQPVEPLRPGQKYTVILASGATSQDGNTSTVAMSWSFETEEPQYRHLPALRDLEPIQALTGVRALAFGLNGEMYVSTDQEVGQVLSSGSTMNINNYLPDGGRLKIWLLMGKAGCGSS
ncbi:hypothetical protein SY88_19935 [Clostridiales bacterium PH28_bin88]|nr:hypothetical protein SY88_19935 [Clostridiales bacterium PH28_bin88]